MHIEVIDGNTNVFLNISTNNSQIPFIETRSNMFVCYKNLLKFWMCDLSHLHNSKVGAIKNLLYGHDRKLWIILIVHT